MSERPDTQRENRLREGYERMLARLREGSSELNWETLQRELDDAVEFEAELQEYTVAESLLSIADRSVVDSVRLNEDLEAARADYCEGEMAVPGRMACVHCDAEVDLEGVTLIEPCHQCGHRYFVRVSQ